MYCILLGQAHSILGFYLTNAITNSYNYYKISSTLQQNYRVGVILK